MFPSDAKALRADAGSTLAFVRVVARTSGEAGMNLYDGALLARLAAAER